jgi:hypothetical protein
VPKAEHLRVNADEQKLQNQTQFVRRRRSVFDSSKEPRKKPLAAAGIVRDNALTVHMEY